MERKAKPRSRVTRKEDELQQELKEFIQELKTPEGLLLMSLLDEALPQLHGIHETLKELNEEISQKLSRLEQL